METTIFEIKFKSGRTFRIFCANRSQKNRMLKYYNANKDIVLSCTDILNGINTITQFENIAKNIQL